MVHLFLKQLLAETSIQKSKLFNKKIKSKQHDIIISCPLLLYKQIHINSMKQIPK